MAQLNEIAEFDLTWRNQTAVESGVYYHQRDYEGLVEVSRNFVAHRPQDWPGHYFLGVGYDGLGQYSDAVSEYQKAVTFSQGEIRSPDWHGYAGKGRRVDTEKILADLLRQSKRNYVSPYMIATVYVDLGQKDKAFEFLEKAYQERSPDVPYFLKADLRLDPIRSEPRFQDLLRRVGLPK